MAKLPCWVFIICVSVLMLIFMARHRGYASTPRSCSFLAVGMLALHQLQAFGFLYIPLSSITFMILLQTSYADFPGSWNQSLLGDQINLESCLVSGILEEPGFFCPHSCFLA